MLDELVARLSASSTTGWWPTPIGRASRRWCAGCYGAGAGGRPAGTRRPGRATSTGSGGRRCCGRSAWWGAIRAAGGGGGGPAGAVRRAASAARSSPTWSDAAVTMAARGGDAAPLGGLPGPLRARGGAGLAAALAARAGGLRGARRWWSDRWRCSSATGVPLQDWASFAAALLSNPAARGPIWARLRAEWPAVTARLANAPMLWRRVVEAAGLLTTRRRAGGGAGLLRGPAGRAGQGGGGPDAGAAGRGGGAGRAGRAGGGEVVDSRRRRPRPQTSCHDTVAMDGAEDLPAGPDGAKCGGEACEAAPHAPERERFTGARAHLTIPGDSRMPGSAALVSWKGSARRDYPAPAQATPQARRMR